MKPLTGYQRSLFTKEWIRRGKPPTREAFIKKCCEAMKIVYAKPTVTIDKSAEILIKKGI